MSLNRSRQFDGSSFLVVMRRHFQQPLFFNHNHVSHRVLGFTARPDNAFGRRHGRRRLHDLVEQQDRRRLSGEQDRSRMNVQRLSFANGLVNSRGMISGRLREES